MDYFIGTVKHAKQRYDTVGDWQEQSGDCTLVTVSELGDWRYEALVGIHELIEAVLCKNDDVDQTEVDAFDMQYERRRDAGLGSECGCPITQTSEPGEDVHAPYTNQHAAASFVERFLAHHLGVNWKEYEAACLKPTM